MTVTILGDPLDGMTINPRELSRSFTGYDEIAIEQRFKRAFTDLPATLASRAMIFVQLRRDGAKDNDAYKVAMDMPLGRIDVLFVKVEDAEGNGSGPSESGPSPIS